MRHDVEYVDGVVCIHVACAEVVAGVAAVRFFEQVADALLQVADVDESVEVHVAHVIEEVGIERGGLVRGVGVGTLGNVAARSLPGTVTADGEVVSAVVVQVERTPVGLALHVDLDVIGVGARCRVVEDDGGQGREEALFRHVAQVELCRDVGDGLRTDVDILQRLRECRPQCGESVFVYVQRLQRRQCTHECRDITL